MSAIRFREVSALERVQLQRYKCNSAGTKFAGRFREVSGLESVCLERVDCSRVIVIGRSFACELLEDLNSHRVVPLNHYWRGIPLQTANYTSYHLNSHKKTWIRSPSKLKVKESLYWLMHCIVTYDYLVPSNEIILSVTFAEQGSDKIMADGIGRFCEDLNLDPASLKVLIIAWKFKAATQCEFTKKEFSDGMAELGFVTVFSMGYDSSHGISEVWGTGEERERGGVEGRGRESLQSPPPPPLISLPFSSLWE